MKIDFAKNRRILTMLALLVPLLLLFLWVALRSGPLAPVKVTVAQVEERAISPSLFGIGTVEARYTQKIGPTAPGRITAIAVDVGDMVSPGQLLVQLDPVDLDQRIDSAAGVAARAAAMEKTAAAQIADANARVILARNQAARTEALIKDGWVTQAAVDQRRQELAAAQANLAAAHANRNAAVQDRNAAGSNRAGLIAQRANLRLTAPRAGLVVKRASEPGTTILAGQTIIEIVDPQQLWINARFDQTRSGGIAPQLDASIALRSHPDQPIKGEVIRVEPLADAITEEILAKVGFETTDRLPPIGELAEVTVALPPGNKTLAIPRAAVQILNGKNGVWALRDEEISFAPVALGAQDLGGWVEILTGLKKGDQIIVYSAATLDANSRISIVDKLP